MEEGVSSQSLSASSQSDDDDVNNNTVSSSSTKRLTYDFVIIGQGNSGQSAFKELRRLCPGATIALVDAIPRKGSWTTTSKTTLYSLTSSASSFFSKLDDFYPQMATSIDPKARIVRLGSSENKNSSCTELQYKCAALIATGARGAPVPSYLVDKQAWPFVLELRPTMFPQLQQQRVSTENGKKQKQPSRRHCVEPVESRRRIIEVARQGRTVGILGSGWDAIDLAIACAHASSGSGGPRRRTRARRDRRPTLIYGAVAPLSHILPQYLSSAVAKRLRSKRILTQDRTLVRYVSYDRHEPEKKLGLYTAKAYDVMDSQKLSLDWLIVSPEVRGLRGNATLPTNQVPFQLQANDEGRAWYHNWSQFSTSKTAPNEPPMLLCYQDDGRLAVNAELNACSRVYAAGSVARGGNAFSGDAQVAGGGVLDSTEAGQVAASNMANHFYENVIFSFPGNDRDTQKDAGGFSHLPICIKDPFPIWRSDVLSYDKDIPSSLSSVGITALCVGTCDSERLTTHGVWWTNQATQQRLLRSRMSKLNDSDEEDKRETTKVPLGKTSVYGIGVVYYLDRTGRIRGIMTWGLPFTNSNDRSLNQELVDCIKEILTSKENRGRSAGTSESFTYFSEESTKLVRMAFSHNQEHAEDNSNASDLATAEDLPRPLHRYTPIWISKLAFRNRQRQGSMAAGALRGEEMFAPSLCNFTHEIVLPSRPAAGVGFSDPSNQAFQTAQNMYEYQVWELKEARWEVNELSACPPKEDPIWIRKGHEDRNTNVIDKRMEDIGRVLGRKQTLGNREI